MDAVGWLANPPKPVGCVPSPLPVPVDPIPNGPPDIEFCPFAEPFCVDEGKLGCGDSLGVVGADGMGGRDSKSAAPKEDDGLNGLRPLKPVFCGCSGAAGDTEMDGFDGLNEPSEVVVAPVGWLASDEKSVSENIELVPVADGACGPAPAGLPWPDLLNENSDATLAMTDPVCCGATCGPKPFIPRPEFTGDDGCWKPFCWKVWFCPPPIASSNIVGGFGTGGGAVTGVPNGLREPVWCVFTGSALGGPEDDAGGEERAVSGADPGRAGPMFAVLFNADCANGCAIWDEPAIALNALKFGAFEPPGKPCGCPLFCTGNGLVLAGWCWGAPVGIPKGDMPVICGSIVLWRNGFAPVA